MRRELKPKLWAIGPTLMRGVEDGALRYVHAEPVLHRVFIDRIGGIGEANAGEFLIETPCGYKGWVRELNRNPERRPTCEACLNHAPSCWAKWPIPEGAVLAEPNAKVEPCWAELMGDEAEGRRLA